MKYLINKMQCNILSHQVGWLDGKGVAFIPKVKASNLMCGVMCGQQWYVTKYSPIELHGPIYPG